MLVLHAIWDSLESKKLHIWAESSKMPINVQKKSTRSKKPKLHPFALPREKLKKILIKSSDTLDVKNLNFDILTILLPSSKKGPLPSPRLLMEVQQIYKPETLKPWFVDTISLAPDTAMDFLLSLPAKAPRGKKYGSTLQFWIETAKFSLELISRQRFVPTFHEYKENGSKFYQAEWNVVITEEDYERLQILSKAMPPCCKALFSDNKEQLKNIGIITDFLNSTVNNFVRNSLVNKDISLVKKSKRKKIKLSEMWLKALTDKDPTIKIPEKKAEKFSKDLEKWLFRILPIDLDAPFRTCFRVESPDIENQEKNWKVTFHIQAKDDKSLLVPAEKVWKTHKNVLTHLKRRFENPQEKLLEDLAKASRVFPEIENSLQTSCPLDVTISTNQAYNFLRESAPLLEQNGFGVLLPTWWEKPSAKLGVKIKLRPKDKTPKVSQGFFGLDSIVEYSWEIAMGDQTFSPEEFEELARLKVPLVQVKGQWVELRKDDIEKAIAFFKKKHGKNEMEMREALRLALSGEDSDASLPIVGVEADGWVNDIFKKLSGGIKINKMRTPKTFNGKLRPYQLNGYSWMYFLKQFSFGACLADDMGLGKTIQFITLMLKEKTGKEKISNPTLIISPMSVVTNWQKEIERFGPSLNVMVHHGQNRLSGEEFENEVNNNDIVISTYALALRDKEDFSNINWHCIALDEAQNIKNPQAKQTKAIKKLNANYKVALTGTPVENRLSELWSIMDFLNPGYLKSLKDFHTSFAVPIEKYRDTEKSKTLKNLIQPFVLRRLKSDPKVIKDLPEKIEMKVFSNLTEEQATLYSATVAEMMRKIEESSGIKRKGLVLSTLMSLKQLCNHPALFLKDGSSLKGRSGKLIRLTEMLEEVLAEGDKALIFTQFAEMGMMLRSHLQDTFGYETLFLYGGTRKKERDNMISRFQSQENDPSLFILSLKAGGLGLNLTAANHVFHFDRWWNPAVENQATDRAFRIGQKKNVQVHKFVCIGTLEERIDLMIEKKKELAESIVGSGEGWLTELSTEQLKELFSLSKEAIGGE